MSPVVVNEKYAEREPINESLSPEQRQDIISKIKSAYQPLPHIDGNIVRRVRFNHGGNIRGIDMIEATGQLEEARTFFVASDQSFKVEWLDKAGDASTSLREGEVAALAHDGQIVCDDLGQLSRVMLYDGSGRSTGTSITIDEALGIMATSAKQYAAEQRELRELSQTLREKGEIL